MPTTFDTPVLVAEVSQGRDRIQQGNEGVHLDLPAAPLGDPNQKLS